VEPGTWNLDGLGAESLSTSDAWILTAIPLGAFFVLALDNLFTAYRRRRPIAAGGDPADLPDSFFWRQGDWIGVLAILTTFALALAMVGLGLEDYPDNLPGVRSWEWMSAGDYELRIGFFLDEVAMVMLVVVTTVALMVNVYSLGYMKGEVRYGWFFAVLALFAFSMLSLVLADSLLLLFIAWELVGVCSYFLIGFYWERRSAVEAAKKAFVVNRIGDVGLLIGIILLWRSTGTFNIQAIIEAVENGEIGDRYLTITTLFLFLGPVAKSAQVPLHVWLPDAMEGPTPVSALIHAATMVVAGIYLVARMLPVFEAAPYLPEVVMVTGMLTALLGATIALAQTDLKRVIAYSTISNLGFMMLALGAGALTAAMFHLMTHAFFKACLFLGAGSVIHSTGHQEMDKLGGLRKYMPITFITFLIAALANAGIPPLAGFWSKDEVLHALEDYPAYFILAVTWVVISGMYTARMLKYTFWGRYRGADQPVAGEEADADTVVQAVTHAEPAPPVAPAPVGVAGPAAHALSPQPADLHPGSGGAAVATLDDSGSHGSPGMHVAHGDGGGAHDDGGAHGGHGHGGVPHESPFSMTLPLIILAILSIFSGFIALKSIGEAVGLPGGVGEFVYSHAHGPEEFHFDWTLATIGSVAALAGIAFALYMVATPERIRRFTASIPEIYSLVANKYYFDELYQWIVDKIFLAGARLIAYFDRKVINDTGVDGPSFLTRYLGYRLKFIQTGRLPNYAFIIVLGVLVLAVLAYTTRT
jgi:proton-translocating NADH-quinone oxidoreductase chain L